MAGDGALETAAQDPNSVFAKFTMPSESNILPTYIVEPGRMEWQEYQNAKTQLSESYLYQNEGYQTQQSSTGYSSGYNYSTKENYDTWKNDKLWLPSMTETGYSDDKIGIWNTSVEQRKNFNGDSASISISMKSATGSVGNSNKSFATDAYTLHWLRSGYSNLAGDCYALDPSGADFSNGRVDLTLAVRPALHLNLGSAAQSAAQAPPPTWVDFAAAKFANEDDVTGDSEENAYQISNAADSPFLQAA